MSHRLIPIGKLVATHGIDGGLKLKAYNPHSSTLDSAREITLQKGDAESLYWLRESKAHNDYLLVKIQGIDGIDDAKKLVGSTLLVAETALEPSAPGEYYYYQTLGLDVVDTRGTWIGKVTRIWFKEGGDLYVVTGDSKDYLIPAVREVIEKIDLHAGKMVINPPQGLLDV